MGDRTTVVVTILKADQAAYESVATHDNDSADDHVTAPNSPELVTFTYNEVNYAELDFEPALVALSIPYDKEWEAGSEYGAGGEYCRLSADNERTVQVFDHGEVGLVPITEVEAAWDEGTIEDYIKRVKAEVIVMTWTEQAAILSALADA